MTSCNPMVPAPASCGAGKPAEILHVWLVESHCVAASGKMVNLMRQAEQRTGAQNGMRTKPHVCRRRLFRFGHSVSPSVAGDLWYECTSAGSVVHMKWLRWCDTLEIEAHISRVHVKNQRPRRRSSRHSLSLCQAGHQCLVLVDVLNPRGQPDIAAESRNCLVKYCASPGGSVTGLRSPSAAPVSPITCASQLASRLGTFLRTTWRCPPRWGAHSYTVKASHAGYRSRSRVRMECQATRSIRLWSLPSVKVIRWQSASIMPSKSFLYTVRSRRARRGVEHILQLETALREE
jgi:hypothetical protein